MSDRPDSDPPLSSEPIDVESTDRGPQNRNAAGSRPPIIRRALIQLGIAVSLIGGLHYYIGTRLITAAGVGGVGWWVAWSVLWCLLASIPLRFLPGRLFGSRLARAIRRVSNLWIGAFGLLLSAVVITDMIRLGWIALAHPDPRELPLSGAAQTIVVLLLVAPAIALGYVVANGPAKLEKLRFPIAKLGKAFEGFRIVQLSDLHVSEDSRPRFLDQIVDRVNALKPDLVAITGDLIDGDVDELRKRVAPLARLQAPEGVFFVTGNHEYYHGADGWEAEMRRLGMTVLHNEHRVLRREGDALVVAGVTDYHGGQFHPTHASRPDLALSQAPEGVPRILLAHQPRSAADAAHHQVDLQLSGHTHGGQIFPFMFFVRLQQPVISGLRRLYGIWVYTSRGTGFWGPPMRVGPSPEITEIQLVSPA